MLLHLYEAFKTDIPAAMNLSWPYWGHSALSSQGMLHHGCINICGRGLHKTVVLLHLLKKYLFLICQLPSKVMANFAAV